MRLQPLEFLYCRCEGLMGGDARAGKARKQPKLVVLNAPVDPMHAVCVTAGGDDFRGWSCSIVDTQEVVNAQKTQAEC
jgi:hypothetical protein